MSKEIGYFPATDELYVFLSSPKEFLPLIKTKDKKFFETTVSYLKHMTPDVDYYLFGDVLPTINTGQIKNYDSISILAHTHKLEDEQLLNKLVQNQSYLQSHLENKDERSLLYLPQFEIIDIKEAYKQLNLKHNYHFQIQKKNLFETSSIDLCIDDGLLD